MLAFVQPPSAWGGFGVPCIPAGQTAGSITLASAGGPDLLSQVGFCPNSFFPTDVVPAGQYTMRYSGPSDLGADYRLLFGITPLIGLLTDPAGVSDLPTRTSMQFGGVRALRLTTPAQVSVEARTANGSDCDPTHVVLVPEPLQAGSRFRGGDRLHRRCTIQLPASGERAPGSRHVSSPGGRSSGCDVRLPGHHDALSVQASIDKHQLL